MTTFFLKMAYWQGNTSTNQEALKERYAHFEDKTLKKAISVFDNGDDSKAGFGKSLANL